MRSDWLPLLGRWTLSAPLIAVVDVESLRVIAETFHAAKKLIEEDVLITDTKLDKYETWSVFAAAFCNHKCTNSHTRFAQQSKQIDGWSQLMTVNCESKGVFFSNIRSIRGIRSTLNRSFSNPRKTLRVLNQIQICSEASEKHLTARWDFCKPRPLRVWRNGS